MQFIEGFHEILNLPRTFMKLLNMTYLIRQAFKKTASGEQGRVSPMQLLCMQISFLAVLSNKPSHLDLYCFQKSQRKCSWNK